MMEFYKGGNMFAEEVLKLVSATVDKHDYDIRKVEREYINGLIISTAYTDDMGYETAILDMNGVHPVERYNSKEEAEKGHKKWVEFCKTKKIKIKKLGYGELINSQIIILKRSEEMKER